MIKNREIIIYVIVGGLTTIFSWAVFGICTLFLEVEGPGHEIENAAANTIAWVAGVLFAYPLNRKWVFQSTNKEIIKEFFGFSASRLSTWVMDIVIMYLMCNKLCMNEWIAKIFISSPIVMVANYVFSKLLIFKKQKK